MFTGAFNHGWGILLTGLAIKLMDDFLDQDLDQLLQKKTLAMKLGDSSLPYALLLLTLGILLGGQQAASLFLVSYILGMHGDLKQQEPLGLKGYQESVFILILSVFILHPLEIFTAFLIMLAIQIGDDFFDYFLEPFPGRKNLIKQWGKGACLVALLISLSLSLILDPQKTLWVLLLTPIIIYCMEKRETGMGRGEKSNTRI